MLTAEAMTPSKSLNLDQGRPWEALDHGEMTGEGESPPVCRAPQAASLSPCCVRNFSWLKTIAQPFMWVGLLGWPLEKWSVKSQYTSINLIFHFDIKVCFMLDFVKKSHLYQWLINDGVKKGSEMAWSLISTKQNNDSLLYWGPLQKIA